MKDTELKKEAARSLIKAENRIKQLLCIIRKIDIDTCGNGEKVREEDWLEGVSGPLKKIKKAGWHNEQN